MADDDDKPEKDIKETVVPDPEETTPEPHVTPQAVNDKPDDDIRELVEGVMKRVDDLAETVSTVVQRVEPDTRPVKRPWTHWGNGRQR